jgi:hypothetical protein
MHIAAAVQSMSSTSHGGGVGRGSFRLGLVVSESIGLAPAGGRGGWPARGCHSPHLSHTHLYGGTHYGKCRASRWRAARGRMTAQVCRCRAPCGSAAPAARRQRGAHVTPTARGATCVARRGASLRCANAAAGRPPTEPEPGCADVSAAARGILAKAATWRRRRGAKAATASPHAAPRHSRLP